MVQKSPNDTQRGLEQNEKSILPQLDRPLLPPLRSDASRPQSHTLAEFRESEGRANRKRRLQELWLRLPQNRGLRHISGKTIDTVGSTGDVLTPEQAEQWQELYEEELLGRCNRGHDAHSKHIEWAQFKRYAEEKEMGEFCWQRRCSRETIYSWA